MDNQSHCTVFPGLPSFAEPPLSIDSPRGLQTDQCRCKKRTSSQDESNRCATGIGVLPDNVLLDVFDFNRPDRHVYWFQAWNWHILLHVCQRWRQVVFASPHRLKLQIYCTHNTPVRNNLSIWPAFPIVLNFNRYPRDCTPFNEENAITAFEHSDRVCSVSFHLTGSQLGKMAMAMQKPFPVLTHLGIFSTDRNAPVLPSEFLEGSTPCLQEIFLSGISFPALPMLLLTTNDLTTLSLEDIPPTGYISPETVAACLAALPQLDELSIGFQSGTPRPDRIRRPPVTRTVLVSLTYIKFEGASEYLEALVARIDVPQLNWISITYLNQFVDFKVPQPELSKFIDESVSLTPFRRAEVAIYNYDVAFTLYDYENYSAWDSRGVHTTIGSKVINWHDSLARVLSQFSATLSNVVLLKLKVYLDRGSQLEAGNVKWLHILHRFSAVQSLCVSLELAVHVALALEHITAVMASEVLPSLHSICLMGLTSSSIKKFIAARRLCGRPVTVINATTEAQFRKLVSSQ